MSPFRPRPDPHVYHQELGDTSDALPGNWNRTVFDSASVPSSRDRNNRSTGVCVRNIRQVADTIICDVIVRPESVGFAVRDEAPVRAALAVAPNPARSGRPLRVSASLHPFITSSLSVLSPSGRLLHAFTLHSSLFTLDLPGLAPGVYLLRLESGSARATQKLLVAGD
jgi:hypothetical protein